MTASEISEPTEVTETTELTEASEPTELTEPSEPSEPSEPTEPTDSSEPAEQAVPARRLSLRSLLKVLVIAPTASAAVWSQLAAHAARDTPAARNVALADVAATAEVKNQITQAVDTLFSFDFTDPSATDGAASADLTGAAVNQYASLMAPVRSRAGELKLVLTTTVTSAGVQTLRGDRARVLLFAAQTDTSTATAGTSESSVALAVDAVLVGGKWRIAGMDTSGA